MENVTENNSANVEETQPATKETVKTDTKSSQLKNIIKSISELGQKDRIELYRHINKISNYDHDRASVGNTDASQVFEETLKGIK